MPETCDFSGGAPQVRSHTPVIRITRLGLWVLTHHRDLRTAIKYPAPLWTRVCVSVWPSSSKSGWRPVPLESAMIRIFIMVGWSVSGKDGGGAEGAE